MSEWTTLFSDQKASRLTAKEWCNQNSLSIRTYNYWKYALKEELANQLLPNSVPIAIPETSVSLASIISNELRDSLDLKTYMQ